MIPEWARKKLGFLDRRSRDEHVETDRRGAEVVTQEHIEAVEAEIEDEVTVIRERLGAQPLSLALDGLERSMHGGNNEEQGHR